MVLKKQGVPHNCTPRFLGYPFFCYYFYVGLVMTRERPPSSNLPRETGKVEKKVVLGSLVYRQPFSWSGVDLSDKKMRSDHCPGLWCPGTRVPISRIKDTQILYVNVHGTSARSSDLWSVICWKKSTYELMSTYPGCLQLMNLCDICSTVGHTVYGVSNLWNLLLTSFDLSYL